MSQLVIILFDVLCRVGNLLLSPSMATLKGTEPKQDSTQLSKEYSVSHESVRRAILFMGDSQATNPMAHMVEPLIIYRPSSIRVDIHESERVP